MEKLTEAANFQKEVSKFMLGIGFTVGQYNPSTYYHPFRDIKTFVHGDDFVTSASQDNCQWLKSKLEERFDIKTSTLDPMKAGQEERILHIIIRVTPNGWKIEADQRHVDIVLRQLHMQKNNYILKSC